MCGIAGYVTSTPSSSDLRRAGELLIHRGPDDAGIYLGNGVGLVARRLSIIDLRGGHQPLSNEDGTVWIVYNGEIYNAPSLRARLEATGHHFATRTDTEVIVHAYEQWGEAAVTRLRGMFAFALWDARQRLLLLARDRFGMKPLSYARDGGRFAFASEVRPLLALLPAFPRRANQEALWRLFELGFIPAPLTPFQGVYKLPPGHVLTFQQDRLSLRPYWHLAYPPAGTHQTLALSRQSSSSWPASRTPLTPGG